MKVIFFGKDRYYAEGLCILLEEIYKEQCHSIFFSFNEASLLMEKLNENIYDLFAFDMTSYGANELRYIDRVIASQFQRRVCIIDDGINKKNTLSHEWWADQQAISKSWPVARVKNKLIKFKNQISKGVEMYHGGGLKKSKINSNEIRLIILLSRGVSIKNIARRLSVSDKTLYHQVSIIKRKVGLERKNQFLTFLSSLHHQDGF